MQFTVEKSAVVSFVDREGKAHKKIRDCIMCGACCCEVPSNWPYGVKVIPKTWFFLIKQGYKTCCACLKYFNSNDDKFYSQKFNCQAPMGIPYHCLQPNIKSPKGKYEPFDICTVEYD